MDIREPTDLGNVVEVDETYVGGKVANMSRGRRKKWQESGKDNKTAVMGLLKRDGKARLEVIGNRSFKELYGIMWQDQRPFIPIPMQNMSYWGLNTQPMNQ